MFRVFQRCVRKLLFIFISLSIIGWLIYQHFVIEDQNKSPVFPKSSSTQRTSRSVWFTHTIAKSSPSFQTGVTVELLTRNIKTCQADKSLLFAILVYSPVENFERRKTIRATWVNKFAYRNITLSTVFLIGKTNNVTEKRILLSEQNFHQDMIQGNFMDTSEHSLLLKGVMGYKWVAGYCEYSDLVIMARDDMFVNLYEYLVHIFEKYKLKRRHMFCEIGDKRESLSHKVHLSDDKDNLSMRSGIPSKFCKSRFVIMTSDIVFELSDAAEQTPMSSDPDEHLYGVLPNVVQDITFVDLKVNVTMDEDDCLRKSQKKLPTYILACKATKREFMYRIWRNSLKRVPKEKRTLFSSAFQSIIYNFARNFPILRNYDFEKIASNVTKARLQLSKAIPDT